MRTPHPRAADARRTAKEMATFFIAGKIGAILVAGHLVFHRVGDLWTVGETTVVNIFSSTSALPIASVDQELKSLTGTVCGVQVVHYEALCWLTSVEIQLLLRSPSMILCGSIKEARNIVLLFVFHNYWLLQFSEYG